jgi:hypothetical protein
MKTVRAYFLITCAIILFIILLCGCLYLMFGFTRPFFIIIGIFSSLALFIAGIAQLPSKMPLRGILNQEVMPGVDILLQHAPRLIAESNYLDENDKYKAKEGIKALVEVFYGPK